MKFLNLLVLLSSKASSVVQHNSIMLELPFKVYLGLKCQSFFLLCYINQIMTLILVLIKHKDPGFKTF